MRQYVSYAVLLGIKLLSRLFYRFESAWIGDPPANPWDGLRLVCLLNHTSLFEPLFAATVPNRFLKDIAARSLVPAADKTVNRPLVGRLLSILVRHPVPITREPDHTWDAVLERIDDDAMVIILPEGRMRRRTGLDLQGRPMTARGGIADILDVIREGPMLIAYSGGLHHVQAPGERLPRLFKTVRIAFERLEIAEYREALLRERGQRDFKSAVKADLDRRRDLHSPMTAESTAQPELSP